MQTKTLHRHLLNLHWYVSMSLAIVALLVTATRTSGDLVRFLEATPAQRNVMSSITMREAETVHSAVVLGGAIHLVSTSGS